MRNETIVDRVVERLKSQPLGDLITEEDLHDIVKQAVPKTFFEPHTEGTGYNAKTTPPLIIQMMRETLKASAQTAVQKWVDTHGEEMVAYWKRVLDEGLNEYVQKLQSIQAADAIRMTLKPMLDQLNEERSRNGLSYLII